MVRQQIEVCISVDDLPVHGPTHPELDRRSIASLFIQTLQEHSVQRAIGFVNGGLLEPAYVGNLLRTMTKVKGGNRALALLKQTATLDPKPYLSGQFSSCSAEHKRILEDWVNAGHVLGNHNYWHSDLNSTDEALFIKGIAANEALLAELQSQDERFFRYPFLKEGSTKEKRDTIRNYLCTKNYAIVPSTINFNDYAWNRAYLRSLLNRSETNTQRLKTRYLEISTLALKAAVFAANKIYGHDIKHILLLHIGAFTALMLDPLLTHYEKLGVRFIKLEEALSEAAYSKEVDIVLPGKGRTFLDQQLHNEGGLRSFAKAILNDKTF